MKRTALNRHGKSERSRYIRLLDYMFLTYIVLRDKTCVLCGKDAYTGHHIYAKGRCGNVRYDPVNAVGVCWYCHKYKTHTNPEMCRQRIIDFINKKYNTHSSSGTNASAYDQLTARAYLKGNMKIADLLVVELDLANLLKIKWVDWFDKSYTAKIEHLKEMRRR